MTSWRMGFRYSDMHESRLRQLPSGLYVHVYHRNVAELCAISCRFVQYRFVPFRFVPRRLCSSAAMSCAIEAVTIAAASKENAFGNVGCFSVAPGKVASGRSASCTTRQSTPIYGKQVSVYSTRQYTNRTPTQPLT